MKLCEICNKEIPGDYQNLLCDNCYRAKETENTRKPPTFSEAITLFNLTIGENGTANPDYKTNPQADDKEQWSTNLRLFERHGVILWKPTRTMYAFIKDWCMDYIRKHPQYPKFIWRPKIVDVGCGIGAGSNVLSQEADFVWGIDKNERSVRFAKEAFTRNKNNIYYSSQISFDHIDFMEDNREFMKFDVVVAIEVIEHIEDWQGFVSRLIQKFDNGRQGVDGTTYFISTPNRNNRTLSKEQPTNKFHVREWTSQEMATALGRHFSSVKFYNSAGVPVEYETDHTPLLAECRV